MGAERTANVVLTADVDPYRESIAAAGNETRSFATQVDSLAKSLDNLSKAAGNKLQIFGAGTLAGITGATMAYASYEKQLESLQAQAAVTGRSFASMEASVDTLRKKFPVATNEAAALVETLERFSDRSKPVGELAETFVKLSRASGEASTSLAQGLLQLQRTMGTSQTKTDSYANVLVDLTRKNGVAAQSVLEFSTAIAPVAKMAGMTQAEVMGVATAFSKAGSDGYLAANAFNGMLRDITHLVATGSPELAKYSNLVGMTVEQFKSGNTGQNIIKMFEELNRMGPEAIGVLNRMGYDGARTLKSIAAVSQQNGGLASAIGQSIAAYNDPNNSSLNKGAAASMDGISDRFKKLTESVKSLTETIGENFEGPAKVFISTLEKLVKLGEQLADSPIIKFFTKLAAVIAPLAIATGTLLKMAPAIAALATLQVWRRNNFTGGFRAAVTGQGNEYTAARAEGRTNAIGNTMQRGGALTGLLFNRVTGNDPSDPSTRPRSAGQVVSRVAGVVPWAAARGLDTLRTAMYDPLQPRNVLDPSRRFLFLSPNAEWRRPGSWINDPSRPGSGTWTGYRNQWRERFGAAPIGQPTHGRFGATFAANTAAALGAAGRYGAATLGAGVGGAMMLGGLAGRGVAAAGRAIMAPLGGPVGLGLMGATMGVPMLQAAMRSSQSLEGQVGTGRDNINSVMDTYNAAVGKATTSVNDFATALKKAATEIKPATQGEAMAITAKDIALVSPNRELTDKRFSALNQRMATQLVSSGLTDATDPQAIQELKLDLIQRYGVHGAEQIFAAARKNKGQFDTSSYLNDLFEMSGGFGIKVDENTKAAYNALGNEIYSRVNRTTMEGGRKAGQLELRSLVNQSIQGFAAGRRRGGITDAEENQFEEFFNETFGKGRFDIGGEVWRDIQFDKIGNSSNPQREFYSQLMNAEKNIDQVNQFLREIGTNRKQVTDYLAGKGDLTGLLDTSNIGARTTASLNAERSLSQQTEDRIFGGTQAGRIWRGNEIIEKGTSTGFSGDVNTQIQAIDEMVRTLRKSGMTYAEVDRELLNFMAAVKDVTDPLYQLAAAARQVNAQNLAFKLPYMGRGEQFHFAAEGTIGTLQANIGPEGRPIRKEAREQFEAAALAQQQFMESELIRQRQFDISMRRAATDFGTSKERMGEDFEISQARAYEDFARQRKYSEDDYQLSRKRALEDFNLSRRHAEFDFQLSRQRAEDDFARQRKRNLFDYNLSRRQAAEDFETSMGRSGEDFELSRMRGEHDFQLSRKRAELEYNISRKHAYQDFNISRLRAEKDFNHQVDLLVKQSAQNMLNIYDRVTVQRTWSAQALLRNAGDQLQRLQEQSQNLDRLRSMGVSGDVIQQLGLTDSKNAQQLARLVEDVARNPQLAQEFNTAISERIKASSALVQDEDNAAFQEMVRQYQQAQDRAQEDFERAMERGRQSFQRNMRQQEQDYNRALRRAQEDFNRTMRRAQEDYNRTMQRMQDNFRRQMQRADRDFARQMRQSEADFARAMKRQADQFEKNMERGADDHRRTMARMQQQFDETMSRASDDYARSLDRMEKDYRKQMRRARADLKLFREELTLDFVETMQRVQEKVGGYLGKLARNMERDYRKVMREIRRINRETKQEIDSFWGGSVTGDGKPGSTGDGVDRNEERAAGNGGGTQQPAGGGPGGSAAPIAPIKGNFVTGYNEYGTQNSIYAKGYHTGDDYDAPFGSAIQAVMPGRVSKSGWGGAYGNYVVLDHGGGLQTLYAHMSQLAVKAGQTVAQGTRLGALGNTGQSSGAHLHFEVRMNGVDVNPDMLGQLARTPGVGMVGGFDPRKEIYPRLENIIENSVFAKIWPRGFMSEQINNGAEFYMRDLFPGGMPGTPGATGNLHVSNSANTKLGQRLAQGLGWGSGRQWAALLELWQRESNWNHTADNPSSSAYGIPQALLSLHQVPRGYYSSKTGKGANIQAYGGDPAVQINWGLKYIRDRYGSPIGALKFHDANNWYGDGAIFSGGPKTIGVAERGPEMVLPLNTKGADFIAALLAKMTVGGEARNQNVRGGTVPMVSNYYQYKVDSSQNFTGPISVTSANPDEMAEKLRLRARRQRLVNPVRRRS